ncbi:MAG TPA: hypothetical protein VIV40_10570 [Kofleriaceae bacterium]
MSKLTVCFATLCMLAGPVAAAPKAAPAAEHAPSNAPVRKAASADELQQYEMREHLAQKLEKFEGGRGRGIEAGTLIVILLVVIIVLLII